MSGTCTLVLWLASGLSAIQESPRISIEVGCESADGVGVTAFTATLRNTGDADTAIVLGLTLSNGKVYLANDLTLLASRAGSDVVQEYGFFDPKHAVAGRLDPWVVPLPQSARYRVSLPVNQFVSRSSPFAPIPIRTSAWQVRLRLEGRRITGGNGDLQGLRLLRLSSGPVESPTIAVPDQCSRPGARGQGG